MAAPVSSSGRLKKLRSGGAGVAISHSLGNFLGFRWLGLFAGPAAVKSAPIDGMICPDLFGASGRRRSGSGTSSTRGVSGWGASAAAFGGFDGTVPGDAGADCGAATGAGTGQHRRGDAARVGFAFEVAEVAFESGAQIAGMTAELGHHLAEVARASSGSFSGPKTTSATTKMMIR